MVLLLLVCFGMPIVITNAVVSSTGYAPVTEGAQPGGPVTGTLVDEEGTVLGEGHAVELFLAAAGGEPVHAGATTTDAAGAFQLEAPAHEGSYLLKFGGGEWMRQSRPISLLDEAEATEGVELLMRPGCALVVHLTREDGSEVRGGRVYLEGRVGSHFLFGVFDGRFTKELPFEGARVELDGMPPMLLGLRIAVTSGDVVELSVELESGSYVRDVRY